MADTILTALSRTDPEWVEWLWRDWVPPGAHSLVEAGRHYEHRRAERVERDRERLLPEFAD